MRVGIGNAAQLEDRTICNKQRISMDKLTSIGALKGMLML